MPGRISLASERIQRWLSLLIIYLIGVECERTGGAWSDGRIDLTFIFGRGSAMGKSTREVVCIIAMTFSRYNLSRVIMPPFPFYFVPLRSPHFHRSGMLSIFRSLWFSPWPLLLAYLWLTISSLAFALAPLPLLWKMALKHLMDKGKAPGDSSAEQGNVKFPRRARRAQIQAQEEAEYFKDHIPLNIRLEVEERAEEI